MANRKRIQRLRRQMKIETICSRSRRTSTADITYVPMPRGRAYLCAVMVWHSRKVLGWAIFNTVHSTLTQKAIKSAVAQCKSLPEIFNTDQGSQFTSPE